jgi:hypothetical protein
MALANHCNNEPKKSQAAAVPIQGPYHVYASKKVAFKIINFLKRQNVPMLSNRLF